MSDWTPDEPLILVVADDRDERDALRVALSELGRAESFADPRQAFERLHHGFNAVTFHHALHRVANAFASDETLRRDDFDSSRFDDLLQAAWLHAERREAEHHLLVRAEPLQKRRVAPQMGGHRQLLTRLALAGLCHGQEHGRLCRALRQQQNRVVLDQDLARAAELVLCQTEQETAVRLDPQNAYARCWLAIVHFFRGENELFHAEARRALALNPNDPEILADIGHYLAFMGEFERGIELSRRAQQLNPLHPGWYHFSFARYHYNRRDYEAVLAEVRRMALPHFYWMHLLNAAALGQLGRAEAAQSLARIRELKPDFAARAELQKWNAAPEDLEHLLEGLRKAGYEE